ncbi:protoporphyrinogen/coproporphyrinogen oxidase [Mariprofundus ferrooxydans]|uniref:Protoporphyrinogen oxidase, putative n=1 Tax=Mariprofundus ferrooxydans PV-1 TaxID=314345 RepID=Q0EXE7_9PROT|nr:FAD-dependent oxidoreductase [Mariprofundus ferrooxydans]EAU53969.1 protoporphyrinogen oxidase, putative [Mariprofundus ferrooxydans PV-1]KON47084.1 protoporphyrinogen oxidase [Mariprofundus ferrooxydans]
MENRYDMIILGAGISGLAMAHRAQEAGKRVLVLEKEARAGGCFHSETVADNTFWLEMGTHTCFNSYTRLLTLMDKLKLTDQMQGREKLRYRMLAGDKLVAIPSLLHFFEIFTHIWRLFSQSKENRSVGDYYRAIFGAKNYRDVFSHAFNAVICQPASDVPADMLFRKRPRNKSIMRSYTFPGGLSRIIDALEAQLEIKTGQDIRNIQRTEAGYQIETADTLFQADTLVCATPVLAAARLLKTAHPEISEQLNWMGEVEIESVGVVLEKERLPLEPVAGIIAVDGDFWSAVSRDIVGHPHLRGLTFHFKPGLLDEEAKLQRICSVLGVEKSSLLHLFHKTNRLPAPDMGHHQLINAVDGLLAEQPLALVGNYFAGVAVEDCLERVESEFARLVA